jgi:hypothetical protein
MLELVMRMVRLVAVALIQLAVVIQKERGLLVVQLVLELRERLPEQARELAERIAEGLAQVQE